MQRPDMNTQSLIRLLPALGLVSLLAACATPSTGPSTDAVNRHALVRVPAPEPDWPALRQELAR